MSILTSDSSSPLMRKLHAYTQANPKLQGIVDIVRLSGEERNFHRLLPLLFKYEGKPLTLANHYPFEACYDTEMPRVLTKMCARQTGKSLGDTMESIIDSMMINNYKTLVIMPFYEMIRRRSVLYMSPLINESPVKRMMVDRKRPNQVLQRSFPNGSNIVMAYAYNDADRIRGLPSKKNRIDEIQLVLYEILNVIDRTMDGSPHGSYSVNSGTPTTLSGTLHIKWSQSSQSEWVIPCDNCPKDNIASVEYDLEKMIGPWHPDISPAKPGLICASCRFPIFTNKGHWSHRHPDRWHNNRGLHLPQPIMPWHCQSSVRWAALWQILNDPLNPPYKIFNEIYGEPYDSGGGLLGESDMRKAAVLATPYDRKRAIELSKHYSVKMLGIDWGGGVLRYLDKAEGGPPPLSRTKMAVVGLSPSGKLDVLWGWENSNPLDRHLEATMAINTINEFGCSGLAYDTGNGGYFSELIIKMQHNINQRIFRIGYGSNLKQEMLLRHPPNPMTGEGEYFNMDKTRSLLFLTNAIKTGFVRFFNPYTASGSDRLDLSGQLLLADFTNLTQEQISRGGAGSFSVINAQPNTSDDFAHAVNFAAAAIWHTYGYPNAMDMLMNILTPQDVASLGDVNLPDNLQARMQHVLESLSC